jgi:hypothetical protein
MFPITCNAVGDIIAVAALIADIVSALKETSGSPAHYRGFIRELNSMRVVLDSIGRIADRCNDGDLRCTIVDEVQDCCLVLEDGAQRIAKFSPLGHDMSSTDSSRFRLARFWYKVEWRIMKQGEIDKFTTKFSASRQRLTTFMVILSNSKYVLALITGFWAFTE